MSLRPREKRFRTGRPPYSLLTRAIEYDLLPTCQRYGMGVLDPRHRVRPAADLPALWDGRAGLQPTGQWLAVGQIPQRSGDQWVGLRRWPGRFDATNPANAAKLDAADALGILADEAGLTLVQMAVAFAIRHPAITSTIIGPRTMEHLDCYLAADGIELSDDVLDRIDEIVAAGVTINVVDNVWKLGTRALDTAYRR